MDNAPMYGLKMPAKYWDLVSMYSGSLDPLKLKGWGAPANYLLANCDHFTTCNCENTHIKCIFLSMRIVPMHQWKVPLKVSGHASIS